MKSIHKLCILSAALSISMAASAMSIGTFAGGAVAGYLDATGTAAKFYYPEAIATDGLGNLYVADQYNNRIRKITPAGVVTTFAGSGTAGAADGTGTAAQFHSPTGIAADARGNLYVAGYQDFGVRKITPSGVVTTLVSFPATHEEPWCVAVGPDGYLYTTWYGGTMGNKIVKISPTGATSTLAGAGGAGNFADGTGAAAKFNLPCGMAVDASSNVYVADLNNNRIRKVTPAGVVTTLAGSGVFGNTDGTGTAATFSEPFAIAIDGAGNLFVGEGYTSNTVHRVRMVTPAGVVTTVVGPTFTDATTGVSTTFRTPRLPAIVPDGTLYVTDSYRQGIFKVTGAAVPTDPSGISTLAGSGSAGSANGTGTAASFNLPYGGAVDGNGNVFVADTFNHLIRRITPQGVTSTFAGSGSAGSADGTGTAASFYYPEGVATDASNNVYVADTYNHAIRKITPAGVVTTLAGSGSSGFVDGTGTSASFYYPEGVTVDGSGNVFVADTYNQAIRKVSPAGAVSTFVPASFTDTSTGLGAAFNYPASVAVDESGDVFVGDWGNNKLWKATAAGAVSTLAGSGTAGSANGTGTAASFSQPWGIAWDSAVGALDVADYGNNLVRRVTPAGVVSTLAGPGFTNIGTGLPDAFNGPAGVAALPGKVYVIEKDGKVVHKIVP